VHPNDLALYASAGFPRLSPDGSQVAYVVSRIDLAGNTYRSRIWLAATDGSRPSQPLTAGDANDSQPCWSPDGRRLAFTSKRAGKGDATLHVMAVDGPGEVLTLATRNEAIISISWSPDGRLLAFSSRRRDDRYEADDERRQPPRRITHLRYKLNGEGFTFDRPMHVWFVPADGSTEPIDLTPGPHEFADPAWLADSSGLLAVGNTADTWDLDANRFIHRLGLTAGSAVEALMHGAVTVSHPVVSPDGRRVAFLGNDDPLVDPQNVRIGVLDLAGGPHHFVDVGFDRTWAPSTGDQALCWLDDHRVVGFAEDRGNVHVHLVDVDAGGSVRLVDGERTVFGYDAVDDTLVFAASTPTEPSEIFVRRGGNERRLSEATRSFTSAVNRAEPTRFTAGDAEVDVWVFTPPSFDASRVAAYPMLLNIHGGPFTQYSNRFFDEAQVEAAAGYVVVLSNPRGGSGRDNAWGQCISGPGHPVLGGTGWGSVDFEDIMTVTDEVIRRYPSIDTDRLGVLGGSYGGYLTTWTVGHTNRFAAACSERAANNMVTFEGNSDIAGMFRSILGRDHLEGEADLRRMSATTYVRDISTPLLILHSEDDLRCPINQAEELFVAMRLLGKSVEFVRFPAETHELSRSGSPVHRQQRFELILEFFAKHLKPELV